MTLQIFEHSKKSIPSSGKFLAGMMNLYGNEITWSICEWCQADKGDDETYGLHSFAAFGYVSDIKYINPDTILYWADLPCKTSILHKGLPFENK